MNYEKLYYAIINKALRKELSGQRWKGDGKYYEKHHIKPRSLEGTDCNNNLVLLTAKEHYLCHWLLVKRYEINTLERKKMIKAWFMMAGVGDTGRTSISMRDYEKYRTELGKYISEHNKINNTMNGKHWYTCLRTGISKPFMEDPGIYWVLGKDWFNIQGKSLWNIFDRTQLVWRRGHLNKTNEMVLNERREKGKIRAQEYWNKFHSGNYCNMSDFCNIEQLEIHSVVQLLKRHIPLYKNIISRKKHGAGFKPTPEYIGVYE